MAYVQSETCQPLSRTASWKILFVLLLAVLVYANSLGGEFIWDDIGFVVGNHRIKSLSNLWTFFTTSLTTEREVVELRYRPLFNVSLALDYAVWGLRPGGFHMTNVLLHALSVLFVYRIALRLSLHEWTSFVAALFFAVHPVHAEAVAWISARVHLLGSAFTLASVYWYIAFRQEGGAGRLAASVAACALAVFSVESAVAVPALLLCYELVYRRGGARYALLVPHLAVTALYALIRHFVVGCYTVDINTIPLAERLLTAPVILVKYLSLFVFPPIIKVGYDLGPAQSLLSLAGIGSVALIAGAAVLTALALGRNRIFAFSMLWFFATSALFLNIVAQLFPMLMAARNLYMPSVGLSIAAAAALWRVLSGLRTGVRHLVLIVLVAPLCLMTFLENKKWASNDILFNHMVADIPESSIAHYYLGNVHLERGEDALAVEAYTKSLEWRQKWHVMPLLSEMYLSLGHIYSRQGMTDEAIAVMEKALENRGNAHKAHYNLGLLYAQKGDTTRGLKELMYAVRTRSHFPEAHFNIGNLFFQREEYDYAVRAYATAVRQKPGFDKALYNLSLSQLLAGNPEASTRRLEELRFLNPELASTLQSLIERIKKKG
jgi:tetratricopeptide (TPR) repeat protein